MFQGFTGWHAIILLLISAAVIAAVVIVIVLAVRSSQRRPPVASGDGVSHRLAQLDALRSGGQISEAEYAAKRSEILGGL